MRQKICGPLIVALATALGGAASAATSAPKGAAAAAAPSASATMAGPHGGPMGTMVKPKPKAPAVPAKLVDINSASKAELKTLPGIGDAEADRIIKNRPYLSKTELVGKGVLPEGPYLSLRYKVVAFQKGRTKVVKPTTRAAPVASAASAARKP